LSLDLIQQNFPFLEEVGICIFISLAAHYGSGLLPIDEYPISKSSALSGIKSAPEPVTYKFESPYRLVGM
jgi:hypothetical protein